MNWYGEHVGFLSRFSIFLRCNNSGTGGSRPQSGKIQRKRWEMRERMKWYGGHVGCLSRFSILLRCNNSGTVDSHPRSGKIHRKRWWLSSCQCSRQASNND